MATRASSVAVRSGGFAAYFVKREEAVRARPTVIVLAPPSRWPQAAPAEGTPIRMGEALMRIDE